MKENHPLSSSSPSPPKAKNGRRKGPWAHAEIEKLRRLFGQRSVAEISRQLSRSPDSIRRMAQRIFSGEPRNGPWSRQEAQKLKDYLGRSGVKTLSQILRRSPQDIQRKIEELREQTRPGEWSSSDLQILKQTYGTRDDSYVAMILSRTVDDVDRKAREMRLAKDKRYMKGKDGSRHVAMPRWKQGEVELLRQIYPDLPNLEIARRMERSVKSVVSKAHELGLKKSNQRLTSMGRENVSLRYRDGGAA